MEQLKINFIFLALIVCYCVSGSRPMQTTPATDKYHNIAIQKFGREYSTVFSPDKQHIICCRQQKPTQHLPSPPLTFFIYDCRAETIILEKELTNGKISWLDNDHIQIKTYPAILTTDEKKNSTLFGYVLNIKTGRKSNINREVEQIK